MSAIYGAAGVIHDPELTRVLLEAGADPNGEPQFGDALYHFDAALTTTVATRLELKLAYVYDYKTKPPSANVKKGDSVSVELGLKDNGPAPKKESKTTK